MITEEKQIAPPIDYEGLRKEALEHIANYSSDSWTDYNTHDPGVTIAEILCFALTELGLRANLPIKDIIAELLNSGQAGFYPAHEILTNKPLTANDYRKLLIDMDGVKNAWLTEIEGRHSPVYIDTFNNMLTLMSEPESCYYRRCTQVKCTFNGGPKPKITAAINKRFGGRYMLLTRIDYQALFDQYPSLKEMAFKFIPETLIVKRAPAGGFVVDQSNLYSRDKFDELFDHQPFTEAGVQTTGALDEDQKALLADLVASLNAEDMDPLDSRFLKLFQDYDYVKSIKFTSAHTFTRAGMTENAWLKVFLDVNGAVCMSSYDDDTLVCRGYYRVDVELDNDFPKDRHADKLADIRSKLNQNRNLCELFPEINIVEDEYVCVCFDIEVTNHADVEAVLSEVVYRLDRFISPDIHSYSLKQMLDKSYSTEEIFNGPLLEHGFIDDDELEVALPKDTLYASDLIQEIMDAEDVLAVNKLMMSSYQPDESGKLIPVEEDEDWELPLDTSKSTKLLIYYKVGDYEYQSQFEAHKGYLPYCLCPKKLLQNIRVLKSKDFPLPFTPAELTFPQIEGQVSGLDAYHSIRNHFPMNYALKDGELPESAADARKAKVVQLRAFLLFFDQLLANGFSQLSKVGDLLTFEHVDQTYFTQLTESEEALQALLTMTPADYLTQIQAYSESSYVFEQRRNRFLDHLLARFAEEFNGYYALADHIYGDLSKERLIRDKERILENIVPWSAERFCAENIAISDMTPVNLSGLEYRLRIFLGMAIRELRESAYSITTVGDDITLTFRDDSRSYLVTTVTSSLEALLRDTAAAVMHEASNMTIEVRPRGLKFLYQTTRGYNGITFESPVLYDTAEEAEKARQECLEFFILRARYQAGLNQSNLTLKQNVDHGDYWFTFSDRQDEFLVSKTFADEAERRQAIDLLYSTMKELRSSIDEEKKEAIEDLLDAAGRVDFDDRKALLEEIKRLMKRNRILGFSNEENQAKSINALLYKAREVSAREISIGDKQAILLGELAKKGTLAKAADLETEAILDAIFGLTAGTGRLAEALKRIFGRSPAYRHLSEHALNTLIVGVIGILKNGKLSREQRRKSIRSLLENAERLPIKVAAKAKLVFKVMLPNKKAMIAQKIKKGSRWTFSITLNTETEIVLESSKLFNSEYLAEIALYEAVDFLADLHFLDEMYIIEHILFHLSNSIPEQTLPVHLDAEGNVATGFDPYSFRITLVLPGETELLANTQFRQYFEKFIREATPSHVFPKICWVSNEQMLAFERAYTGWRLAWVHYTRNCISADLLDDARAELLGVLNDLESIYEEAILGGGSCNCTGEDRPALVLGHTKLGSQNGD